MQHERFNNIDLIKTVAIFFVFSVHFFLNTNFYSTSFYGHSMLFQLFARDFFMSCVPLFLITTGYLSVGKKIEAKYFKKLYPLGGVYLFYSLASLALKTIYLHNPISPPVAILQILNFSADSYSWYINLFIGVFLLAPFVNIIIRSINKREHLVFIAILAVVSIMPDTFINTPLTINNFYLTLYPIFYYSVGTYFRRYPIKLGSRYIMWPLFIATLTPFLIQALLFPNGWASIAENYGSINIAIMSISTFALLQRVPLHSAWFVGFINKFAGLTLDLFLAGFITDKLVYNFFLSRYYTIGQESFIFFAPILVISSLSLATIIAISRKGLTKLFKEQYKRLITPKILIKNKAINS